MIHSRRSAGLSPTDQPRAIHKLRAIKSFMISLVPA